MVKKLSNSGKTKFVVDNMDWGFIDSALECYKKVIEKTEFHERSMMTKEFVLERVKSLRKTFEVEDI